MHEIGLEDFSVVSLDHSWTPGADFGGEGKVSLTATNSQGRIMYFAIVTSTGKAEVLEALRDIGQRPGVKGKTWLVCLDNVAHSGDSEFTREIIKVSGAAGVIQDYFHTTQKITSVLNNAHPDYASGEVFGYLLVP